MIKRSAVFTNTEDNVSLIADEHLPGILIENIDGIYAFSGEVAMSAYSQTHGSRYKNTRMPQRNIVVSGKIFDDFWNNRQYMYRVFRPGSVGRFEYIEPGRASRFADYYVESCKVDQSPMTGQYQISLLCPDAFFYAGTDEHITMASWDANFEFQHEFDGDGEPLGVRNNSMIATIVNNDGVDGIGIKFTLSASGNVTNPYLYHAETGEVIRIGSSGSTYTMDSTKEIVITTGIGQKKILCTDNGVTSSIIDKLDPDSSFFQIRAGVNTIGYNAASGAENLNVMVEYRMRYLGV